jgi:UDP-N-acetylmuramyl tripeptide synthase
MGGAAQYNVANILAAALAAWHLGCRPEAMRTAIQRFGGDNADNPGRANRFTLGGVEILLDYAHNPHGLDALVAVAAAIPSARRAILLGQAGDRDDAAIRGLARSAATLKPDHVVLKEMTTFLRGRAPGEIPHLMRDELVARGTFPEAIEIADGEVAAVEAALQWARPGDLLVLTVHSDRPAVLALLERLRAGGWMPGHPTHE